MEDTPEVSVFVYEQNGTPTGITSLEIIDSTVAGRALLTAADATEQRADLGLGSAALSSASDFATTSHTHVIANVTGLQTALDGKAATAHSHIVADVTGLQTALDGKAATAHTHIIANVTGLQTALDGKAATSHTHAIANVTGLQAALDGKAATAHPHAIADVTGLSAALALGVAAPVSLSGNIQDFTNIPAGVRRVHVLFGAVSTNGTAAVFVRLGTSGGIETAGYFGALATITGTTAASGAYSNSFVIFGNTAAYARFGRVTFTNVDANRWIIDGVITADGVVGGSMLAGVKDLSGTLDRIRIGIDGGVQLFDQGAITILWEF